LDSFDPNPSNPPEAPVTPPPPVATTRADENPVFNLMDIVLIVAVAFIALFLCGTITVFFAYAAHLTSGNIKDLTGNVLVFLPAQVIAYILTVGFMVLLIWQKYRTGFLDAVRWNPPAGRLVYGAAALGAGLGLINELLSVVLQRWIPKSMPIDEYLRNPASAYALAAFGILVAPLVEELFFRGFLYPALARPLGSALAMGLTGGLFALIHSEQLAHAWVPLLLLFAVGVILTAVRAWTKSVATCVVVHMSYNTTLFTTLYIGTCGFRHMDGCWR
jgi:CAAX protease family protein